MAMDSGTGFTQSTFSPQQEQEIELLIVETLYQVYDAPSTKIRRTGQRSLNAAIANIFRATNKWNNTHHPAGVTSGCFGSKRIPRKLKLLKQDLLYVLTVRGPFLLNGISYGDHCHDLHFLRKPEERTHRIYAPQDFAEPDSP